MSVHLLVFDPAGFAPGDFGASGIACPANVARSVRKRQAEFLFGRLAARLALSVAEPSLSAADVAIGSTREPVWPSGVIGSISHCDGIAAAAVERAGARSGIGIDLERVASGEACEALLGTVVDDREMSLLRAISGDPWPLDMLLTLAFSAKESLFKGAFPAVGRYFDFSAARLVSVDRTRRHFRFVLTETLCDRFRDSQCIDVGFDFVDPDLLLTHFVW